MTPMKLTTISLILLLVGCMSSPDVPDLTDGREVGGSHVGVGGGSSEPKNDIETGGQDGAEPEPEPEPEPKPKAAPKKTSKPRAKKEKSDE